MSEIQTNGPGVTNDDATPFLAKVADIIARAEQFYVSYNGVTYRLDSPQLPDEKKMRFMIDRMKELVG